MVTGKGRRSRLCSNNALTIFVIVVECIGRLVLIKDRRQRVCRSVVVEGFDSPMLSGGNGN